MANQIIVLDSDSIKLVQKRNDEIAEHFQSSALAEAYMNGLIDWDGNELCDIHGADKCRCLDLDW